MALYSNVHINSMSLFSCFFNDSATTEIYTLSLHDALPILAARVIGKAVHQEHRRAVRRAAVLIGNVERGCEILSDRKSTRLNSSHSQISYAVFCLKKKNKNYNEHKTIPASVKSNSSCMHYC